MSSASNTFRLWWKMPGSGPDEIWTLETDDKGETEFHFSPFIPSQGAPHLRIRGHKRRASSPQKGALNLQKSPTKTGVMQANHVEAVDAALAAIDRGELEKVVLSRSEFWTTSLGPEAVFESKCRMYPDAMVYLLAHPEAGVWLGASPELLLRRSGDQFETVSLAGTKSDVHAAWTEKEYREQEMVTDFITARLEAAGAMNVDQSSVQDRTYGSIKHLESQILFSSKADESAWLQELHPTPAVGGTPRGSALKFIADHEREEREYYTGFIGWSEAETSSFYVNLRCMACFSDGFRLFAGGGIVSGSDAVEEWEETRAKIETIRTTLNR